jgi:hypothetical protein
MRKARKEAIGSNKQVTQVLDGFFRIEIKQHKADGVIALAALRECFTEVKKLSEWGSLVFLVSFQAKKKITKYVPYVAAAFQFLVLAVNFQSRSSLAEEAPLHVKHFPKDKQPHAQKSVNLVLGDMALALMYNLLLEMPTTPTTILEYEGLFAKASKNLFLESVKDVQGKKSMSRYLRVAAHEIGSHIPKK